MKKFFLIIMMILFLVGSRFIRAQEYTPEEARERFGFNENISFFLYAGVGFKGIHDVNIEPVHCMLHFDDETGERLRISALHGEKYTSTTLSYYDPDVELWSTLGTRLDSGGIILKDVYVVDKSNIYLKYDVHKTKNTNKNNKCQFVKVSYKVGMSTEPADTMEIAARCYDNYDNMMVVNADTIFLLYTNSILKTTFSGGYGGQYWSYYTPELPDAPLAYLCMEKAKLDDTYYLVYLSINGETHPYDYKIAGSTDYGKTWEVLHSDSFEEDNVYDFEFIDKDTWLISQNDRFKPDPCLSIRKTRDRGKTYDTIFTHRKYCPTTPVIKIFGENADKYMVTCTNNCTAVSVDGGNSFEYVINRYDVKETDTLTGYYQKENIFYFYSRGSGYIIRYIAPSSSVDADIAKFKTKLYPNPAGGDSKIYLSLENDRPRAATCRIYNLSGTLLDESRAMDIPRGYHTIDFRTEGYAPGAYFIVVESEGEVIAKEKFVIR